MLNKAVRNSEIEFRGIIENALDIIILINEKGAMTYNSPAFSRQLGYGPEEVLGRAFFDFVHGAERDYLEREFWKLLTDGGPVQGAALEFRFRRKDNSWRSFYAVASNLVQDDTVQTIVLNLRDVTEQKETELELETYRVHLEELVAQRTSALTEALEKEKQAAQQQMTFISMVSHEFRTPLTIIDGNAQIIQKRGSTLEPDVLARRASTIRAAVDRLVTLIETILSANTLESGRLEMTRSACDLISIIRDVCLERLGVSPNHKIKVDVQKGLPRMMLDCKMIHQIMVNLVSNAIKYSPNGGVVEVKAYQEGDMVVVHVTDNGVGIPESELPKIFSRYFRASTSGGIPGTGLGLSLVKQFVELHNGMIGIDSAAGAGTTITVKLPING